MKTLKLKTLSFLLLTILNLTACVSQVNLARKEVNEFCAELEQPELAKAYDRDLLQYKGKTYVLVERYLWSQTHGKELSICANSLLCALRWSDWQHECDKQRSFFRELILGRSSCNAEKPNC